MKLSAYILAKAENSQSRRAHKRASIAKEPLRLFVWSERLCSARNMCNEKPNRLLRRAPRRDWAQAQEFRPLAQAEAWAIHFLQMSRRFG